MITKDLGAVSAYAYAVEKGYTGTEAEYAELMASYASVAQQASQSAQTASEKAQQASASATSASQSADTASASATSAQASAQTASAKASEAQQSATTATTKAQEASQSASESSQSASTAVQAKQDAQTAKTASETAQGIAESARDDAESARDTASQSAQTATEKAQQASASATSASQSASTASASAQTAQTAQQTATAKASEAQQSATTATTKAQEASQSASTASQSASTAVQAKQDAQTAKTASETAQASAESARDDAETARDEAQQYAESIDPQKLTGAYPVDTATGAIASFSDGADNIPMKSVKIRIEPVQDLHGYDNPWAGGGQGNVYPFMDKTTTYLGYTAIFNGNHVTLTGTGASSGGRLDLKSDNFTLSAGTYYFSKFNVTGSNKGAVYVHNGSTIISQADGGTFTLSEDSSRINIGINVIEGRTYNNEFDIMISVGSTAPNNFYPYSNICPISGWDSVAVSHSGVNIFDKATAVQNRYISNDDGLERQSTGCVSTDYVPVKPNTSYYIVTEQQQGRWGAWYDEEKNYISGIAGYDVLTAPSNAQFMRLTIVWIKQGVQYGNLDTFGINYPATDHDYHPYTGQTYDISFPTEAGTVYGGTLDVTKGELVVDRAMVDLGTLTWIADSYLVFGNYFKASKSGIKYNGNFGQVAYNALCSRYVIVRRSSVAFTDKTLTFDGNVGMETVLQIQIKDSGYSDAATFKAAMSGVQLVYELATPQTYHITPTEVRSLLGTNNIWADAGDTEVTYRADTKLYIQKKIAEAISALS